jgi:hypothetical protein
MLSWYAPVGPIGARDAQWAVQPTCSMPRRDSLEIEIALLARVLWVVVFCAGLVVRENRLFTRVGHYPNEESPEKRNSKTRPDLQPRATVDAAIADVNGRYSDGSQRRFRPWYVIHTPSVLIP